MRLTWLNRGPIRRGTLPAKVAEEQQVRYAIAGLAALATVVSGGCATLPEPPSAAVRASLGRMMVVPLPSRPAGDFQAFAIGTGAGAAKGAAIGSAQGLLYSFSSGATASGGGPYAAAAATIAVAVFTAVGAITGGAVGAASAVPPDVAQRLHATVDDTLERLDLGGKLAAAIVERSCKRAELAGRCISAETQDRGIDTAVEVKVTSAGLEAGGADPVARFYLTVLVRAVAVADGSTRYQRDFRYRGNARRYEEWLAEDGRTLAGEFESGIAELAGRILDELFLTTRFPFASGLTAWPGSPEYGTCWLRPMAPAHRIRGFAASMREGLRHPITGEERMVASMIEYERVATLQPLLRWEPVPRPRDLESTEREKASRIRDVRYDLKVWEAPDARPASLAIDVVDLLAPEYRPEPPLKPGMRYFWTFRARYRLDGAEQATRWAYSPVPANAPGMPPAGGSCDLEEIPVTNYYRFETP